MSPSPRRILIAGFCAVVIVGAYAARILGGMADFEVSYRAGQRLGAGETLYQQADGHYMFKYLPASAMIYYPLAHLPLEIAKATWFAIMLLALAWSFALVGRMVPLPHRRYLLLLSGLVLAKYFLHEFHLGQINILAMTVMLLASCELSVGDDSRHEAAAGVLIGIATAMKPYAAVFLPYFVLERKWTAIAASVAALAIGLALPAIFYGVHGNVDLLRQWAVTLSQSTPSLLTNADNVSVLAFFAKWLGSSRFAVGASLAVLGALALLMLAVIVRGGHEPKRAVLECGMLLTLIPLISPLGWDYTFLTSLLAVAIVINAFDAFPRGVQVVLTANFAVIALAVFDVMGRQAYAAFMRWSVTTVNFLIVVIALASLRFKNLA